MTSKATVVTTALAAAIIALAHRLGYADLTDAQAIAFAGGAIIAVQTVGQFVWSDGIKGLALAVWDGAKTVAVGSKAKS